MKKQETAFACLAEAYANRSLPVDSANWDLWQPPDHDSTIEEVLEHFDGSSAAMPSGVCERLQVPSGTSYARGVERIRAFAGPSGAGSVSQTT